MSVCWPACGTPLGNRPLLRPLVCDCCDKVDWLCAPGLGACLVTPVLAGIVEADLYGFRETSANYCLRTSNRATLAYLVEPARRDDGNRDSPYCSIYSSCNIVK